MVCLDCYWKGILPVLLQDKGGIKLWKPVQKFGQKNNEKGTSGNIPKKSLAEKVLRPFITTISIKFLDF